MFSMQSILSIALVFSIITTSLAVPTSRPHYKRSFKVPRLKQHNYVPNGSFALRKAKKKFGIGTLDTVPGTDFTPQIITASKASNSTEDGGEGPSAPQNDAQFLSPVTIGGQQMVLNFDTGSADTWVFNTGLPTSSRRGHTLYDPSNSSTKTDMQGASFDVSYGDGSFANGPVVIDTVDVGGATVEKQAIGVPNQVSESFIEDVHSSGLVGLSFSKINSIRPDRQKTFFDNIAADLSEPVFTASLKTGEAGAYEFGNIDQSLFDGDLTDVPVDASRGFWEVESKRFAIGDGPVRDAKNDLGMAIVDTGTSLMLMDDEIVTAYYEQVEGAAQNKDVGGFVFPCDSVLPDMQVALGEQYMALIPGENMNFARAGSVAGTPICFGGVQSNEDAPLQILGDVFLKSQFVAFNHGDTPTLGLAPHA